MRFLAFDRVTAFEAGRRIECVKCYSMQDEHLRGHYARKPLVPGSVILEAMLQTTGFLVVRTNGYRILPLFSMLEDCVLPAMLQPGTRLDLVGEVVSTNRAGTMGKSEARVDGQVVASIGRVLFAHYPMTSDAELRSMFGIYGDLV